MKMYRQGDVLLKEINIIPTSAIKVKCEDKIILAEGEATGHYHAIKNSPNIIMFFDKANNKMYLNILKPVKLEHEEHAVIDIEPSNYEVIKQREYTPERIVDVRD
jgi:hypothetical protein